uniref:BTB domain-containing protein n=1 Tax=Ditylenchus dipsaci TaxID=166011 RepID=A0A915CPC9_9BILA
MNEEVLSGSDMFRLFRTDQRGFERFGVVLDEHQSTHLNGMHQQSFRLISVEFSTLSEEVMNVDKAAFKLVPDLSVPFELEEKNYASLNPANCFLGAECVISVFKCSQRGAKDCLKFYLRFTSGVEYLSFDADITTSIGSETFEQKHCFESISDKQLNVGKILWDQLKDPELEGYRFPVNLGVITAFSKYFKGLFSDAFLQFPSRQYELKDVSAVHFQLLLKAIYPSPEVQAKNVGILLSLADLYQVEIPRIVNYLKNCPDTQIELTEKVQLAELFHCPQLKEHLSQDLG